MLANCRSIGVDPCAEIDFELPLDKTIFDCTSDKFFKQSADDLLLGNHLDLVFIDGMHLFEYALRDFINIERYSSPSTIVVVDDIFPNHPLQAERKRQSQVWTGDIWKLRKCLQETRPDLNLIEVDTQPAGMLLIRGLNPENHSLRHHYNPIVRKYSEMNLESSADVLNRTNATSPRNSAVLKFLTPEKH